jgi:hypothetical protein
MGSSIRHYGVDLWLTAQSERPEVRKVLAVRRRCEPCVHELIQGVMRANALSFVACALVEHLEGSRAVSSATRRNISLDA